MRELYRAITTIYELHRLNQFGKFWPMHRAHSGGSHALWWKMQRSEQALVWGALELHVVCRHGNKVCWNGRKFGLSVRS